MNRSRGILIAGLFTGVALIAVLLLGLGSARASSAGSVPDSPTSSGLVPPATDNMGSDQAAAAWQAYSAELEQTVRLLQEREAAYVEQINLANQTIMELQDQFNQSSGMQLTDEHEWEEHERHEHEEGENESNWFGGFDD